MKIYGGCHCGGITCQAEADPENTFICHCTDCHTMSGSAFRTVVFIAEDDFDLLSGKLKTYIKTADSCAQRAMMFCPDCGTQIYATSTAKKSRIFGVRLGTSRQRDALIPRKQYYCYSRVAWYDQLSSVEEAS